MKKIFPLLCLVISISCISQVSSKVSKVISATETEDKAAILAVIKQQEEAWNANNLEEFMQGYWKNDSLKFYGSGGLTKGWQQTLDNYKKGYPTKEHLGTLNFKINDVSKIDEGSYWVMGEYYLKRTVGDANGVFIIIFKKIEGVWKIVADMSC
jgi:hypothetical protein